MFRALVFPRGGSRNVFLRAARYLSDLPEHRILSMPKVSPTMEAGRLIEWKKAEGDSFVEDEEIAEVESDKSTMPITARDDGFIARIFVSDDTPDLLVGTPIAITVEEEEFIPAFKSYQVPGIAATPSVPKPIDQPKQAAEESAAPSTGRVPSIVFRYAAKKATNASTVGMFGHVCLDSIISSTTNAYI